MIAKAQDWRAFAATARVLIVNTDLLKDSNEYPTSVDELADPKWSQRCALAMPTFGNPAIHAGVIAQMKGIDPAKRWFEVVSGNAIVMKRDAEVATLVAKGELAWGLTSSADAIAEQDAAKPIAILFPDQSPSSPGTVLVPHAIAVMASARNPKAAAKLADYLVLPTTEDRLAMSDAAQIPLSRAATSRPRVLTGESIRWTEIDFDQASLAFDKIKPTLETAFAAGSKGK
jgi:iron(III) transport system substrate-binding protein